MAILGCSSVLEKIGPQTPALSGNGQKNSIMDMRCQTLRLLEILSEGTEFFSVMALMACSQYKFFGFFIILA